VRVAAHSDARCPSPRCFNSDSGGGRVLRSGDEEWAVLHGGLCAPGYRDSQTWLLGPLSHPPKEWSWLPASPPDHVEGDAPVARFHHTLTLLPRREAAGDDSLALLGGHDRTISPLLDLRLFSLRHASLPRKASGVAAASVSVGWSSSTHVLGPAPSPRAFHSAAHYHHPAAGRGLLLACCGLGPAAGGEEVFAALDDTWAFDLNSGRWLELAARLPHGFARSRAALAVSRDRLLLAGGCRARPAALATYLPLTPGPAFDDVWLLDLRRGLIQSELGIRPAAVSAWERCVLPHERAHRTPHANATAGTLHGGAVVLVLGGHDTFLSPLADEAVDSFGDLADEQAWALHETEAILVGGRPERTEARLCTRGAPHSCGEGGASPSRRQLVGGARMLVQGLETQVQQRPVQQRPGGPTDRLREREAPPGPVAARSAGAHQRLHRYGRLARFRLRGRARRFGARPAAQQEHLDPVPASPAEPLRGARGHANYRRARRRRRRFRALIRLQLVIDTTSRKADSPCW